MGSLPSLNARERAALGECALGAGGNPRRRLPRLQTSGMNLAKYFPGGDPLVGVIHNHNSYKDLRWEVTTLSVGKYRAQFFLRGPERVHVGTVENNAGESPWEFSHHLAEWVRARHVPRWAVLEGLMNVAGRTHSYERTFKRKPAHAPASFWLEDDE